MKKINFFLRTDFKLCSEKFFKITRLFTILFMVAIFSVFESKAYSQDTYTNDASNQTVLSAVDGENNATAIPQQQRITGTITNEAGDPLPGATVQVEGTTLGAITDVDGKYSVDIPNQNVVIVFSFVGYITQKVPVAGKTIINVSMVPTLESLQEVVVIGYGTQKRTTITGSVSIVKGDEVAKIPVANISNSIAGKLAGVSMRPNGGQPGEDNPDIHIRGIATTGTNTPLIVVDGIIRDNINQVDPTIIESVSVLKDAAAVAPYGLGGANGVILITTKKGEIGAPTLTLNSYYGWQTPTYYPKLADAKDYMRMRNESYRNENPGLTTIPFAEDLIANYDALNAGDPDKYPNSNTKDLVNLSVPIQNHNLQLRGGSEKMKYFASMGYYKQDGMFDAVNYSRFNYNMNLESKVTNTTTVSLSILGSKEKTNDLDVVSSANQLFRNGFKFIPTEAIYYTNGFWGQFAGNSPVAVLNSGGYDKNAGNTILSTITVEQQLPFIKGLSVKGTASYDSRDNFVKGWHTPFYFWAQNTATTPYTYTKQISTQEGGAPAYTYLTQTQTQRKYFTYQGFVNYQRSFGLHDITGLFVAEARNNTYDQLYARRNNFAILVDEMNMGSSAKPDYDNGGSSSVGSQIGYVYRLGYVYNNKYMLEASGRYDGHYYFAPGKRWGYFPAFSIGWRISEESFMKNLSYINSLKIRGSWGKSGNLAGTAYQYLSGYTLAGNGYAFGTGTMVQRAYAPRESNPRITWEISTKTDVGFEATLWNSLLMVEADYFFERRTGMLLAPAITVPLEYGLSLADENAGEMENRGIELTVGSRYELQNGLKLGLDANFSVAKNKMVQVFETAATFNNPNRSRTGRTYGTPFGYHALGLFSTADDTNGDGIINATDGYNVIQFGALHPGDVKYEDISGPNGDMIPDGKIDSNDEVSIGYPVYPLISFGFTPTAAWKGFDLSLFFQGSAMVSFNIQTFQTVPFLNNNSNFDYEYFNDHWTPNTQDATYPRATSSPYANNIQGSDFWMRNTSYLRLKTTTFGYTFPKSVIQFLNIKSARVYFSGQNLLTLSSLKFMDPEMGYSSRETAYPNMKSFSFGANVTF
ncbi:MAG: TonB-dependent receptor [Bacteroidales bacterium]|nr:TonB-dependent receptor [Bacteroidales bacterium]MDP3003802.1 TonB-dependent receptor [Bacteroidales bacterium]